MSAQMSCLPHLLERAGLGQPLSASPRHPVAVLTRGPVPAEVAGLFRDGLLRMAAAVQVLESDLPDDQARAVGLARLRGELE